jgi:pilus assembly protein Flp/PilA
MRKNQVLAGVTPINPSQTLMEDVMKKIIDFFKNEEGATVPEYALMLAVIAAVVLAAVTAIGNNSNTRFNQVATAIGS